MVLVVHCKVPGCDARAWQGTLCNLHAFERHQGKKYPSVEERLQRGRALLQQRARELGVELATAPAAAAPVRRRVRSPVA